MAHIATSLNLVVKPFSRDALSLALLGSDLVRPSSEDPHSTSPPE